MKILALSGPILVTVAAFVFQMESATGKKPPPTGDDGFVEGPLASANQRVQEGEEKLKVATEEMTAKAEAFRQINRELQKAPPARKDDYQELWNKRAQEVTDATLRQVEARKEVQRALGDLARVQEEAPPSVDENELRPDAELPAPNALNDLPLELGPAYYYVEGINGVLQSGLEIEDVEYITRPEIIEDPFDEVLADYRQRYDKLPQIPSNVVQNTTPSQFPRTVPEVGPSNEVKTPPEVPIAIQIPNTSWVCDASGSTFEFSAGTLVEKTGRGKTYSTGWKRSGNTATAKYSDRPSQFAEFRREYKFVFEGDRAKVTIRSGWIPPVDTPITDEMFELRRTRP